ncbi:uncharacterized protein TNCV_397361 [Trichonephila clavipes]|nr:uncharacterized protein TNCV_397361 [Trichonephila clavipes]
MHVKCLRKNSAANGMTAAAKLLQSRSSSRRVAEEENPGGGQGPPTSVPLPPTTREDLRLDGYLEYPHAAKALCIYKHPCLLRDSIPVPTAPQSASLTTLPDGRRSCKKSKSKTEIQKYT